MRPTIKVPTASSSGRQQPLIHPNTPGSVCTRTTCLNERLNTEYIDVGVDDTTFKARLTRSITTFVGRIVTPRRLLIVLRILKAITFCFLVLTVAADLMYIAFLEVLADREVKILAGGHRDLIIRIYGLFLAVIAICIEMDYTVIVKSFYGFKGFIPRGLLLLFVSAITGAHPLHEEQAVASQQSNGNADDDAVIDDYVDDKAYAYYNANSTSVEIPGSVIVFQMVTSFILGLCALTYLVFGCFCLDRFTSRAFLSTSDPLVSTAIPSSVQPVDAEVPTP